MKILLIIVAVVASVLFLSACEAKKRQNHKPSNQQQWVEQIKNNKAQGLDVRTLGEVQAHPSPQAKNIPVDQLEQATSELDPSKTIYVFCESGARAGRALTILKNKGFKDVVNIGDWRTWNELHQKANEK